MHKPHVIIISPATANANNGNWQTASRWSRLLRGRCRTTLQNAWDGTPCDLLIALHARRSASSVAAFTQVFPQRPVALVLTGTDVYRDIHDDAAAQASVAAAHRLVLLQEAARAELDAAARAKAIVIHQSAPALRPSRHPATDRFDVAMIGHLRAEKDPQTFLRAAALVHTPQVRLLHAGAALEPALGEAAQTTMRAVPAYRWLGAVSHARARELLRRAQLLVLTSRMEGGANVIIEAVTCGVPVLASDIPGNRGMLGAGYAGCFPVGDSAALAMLIDRCAADPAFLAHLQRQCAARAPLFSPARERAALWRMVDNLLSPARTATRTAS